VLEFYAATEDSSLLLPRLHLGDTCDSTHEVDAYVRCSSMEWDIFDSFREPSVAFSRALFFSFLRALVGLIFPRL
jgi:hypothetical protein